MDERQRRWERRFEIPVLVAALLVIPVVVVEQSDWGDPWQTVATILNWAIWIVFAVELVTMLIVVPNRWRWLRTHPLEVAVVLLTPPFAPASLQAARALRLLRVLRLLRLVKVLRSVFTFEGLRYAGLLAGMTALVGGTAFAAVENLSTFHGIYWAVTTMTTVGYGDITPETDYGRLIAMAVMVVGIGFLSLLIGAAAERFVSHDVAEAEEKLAREVEDSEDDVLREIEEISERLRHLEAGVRRLQGTP